MSTISNRFYVNAIADGTTLHGNLSPTPTSLSQAWDGTTAAPDWSSRIPDPSDPTDVTKDMRPIIYLTLLNGAAYAQPVLENQDHSDAFTWKYNGSEIAFDTNGVSINGSGAQATGVAGVFTKTTYTVNGLSMPALKMTGNLASSTNVDVDTISFVGKFNESGSDIPFEANIQARITTIAKGGYFGVIQFLNGKADITEPNETLTMWGLLYGGEMGGSVQSFTTQWYVNDVSAGAGQQILVDNVTYNNAFQIGETDVVDYATIRCDFLVDNVVKYSAYVGIDDMQDPEFMYVQFHGANANSASLHAGETVTFEIWVGHRDDPTVITTTNNGVTVPYYDSIRVRLLDADGATITGSYSPVPDVDVIQGVPDPNGYRSLTKSGNHHTIQIPYDFVNSPSYGKRNVTGIILASHTEVS